MLKGLTKIKNNIPPKARIALILTASVGVGGSFLIINSMIGGSEDVIGNAIPASATVASAPQENQLPKTKPGDEIKIPEDSPIGQEIVAAREAEIDHIKKRGGGFIDRIQIDNSTAVIKDADKQIESAEKDASNGLSSVESRVAAQRKIEEQKARINRQKELAESERQQMELNQARERMQAARRQSREAFLSKELANVNGFEYKAEIERVTSLDDKAITSSVSGGSSSSSGSASGSSRISSKADRESNRETAVQDMIDRYTRDSYATVDQGKIDRYRSSASGGASGGTSESYSGGIQQASYQSASNPVGSYNNSTTELVNSGSLFYSKLQFGVNSDEIAPVRAVIPGNGTLGDAVLLGNPIRSNDVINILFDRLIKDGKEYQINAVAVNPETLRPGLADDVDRHIFERYFMLSLAAAGDGYLKAITGYTEEGSGSESKTIYEALPDKEDQVAAMLGSVGSALLPNVRNAFNRQSTVIVNANSDVLIMFMDPVEVDI